MAVKIYDVTNQKLIGVFNTASLAARYLDPYKKSKHLHIRLKSSTRRKEKIYTCDFASPLSARECPLDDLNGENYVIYPPYRLANEDSINGFTGLNQLNTQKFNPSLQ